MPDAEMTNQRWNKEVEAAYFRSIPAEALEQALNKPFSVSVRAPLLFEFATVLSFLPEPPARIADFGCGTGWTSAFMAQCGYTVVGFDLSSEAIAAAAAHFNLAGLSFVAHDFDEPLPAGFVDFDGAVFFDALHHCDDERLPLCTAYQAMAPGGTAVVCEPGAGHSDSEGSLHATRTFGVQERDMPPHLVRRAAQSLGFSKVEVYPHPSEVMRSLYLDLAPSRFYQRLLASNVGRVVRILRTSTVQRHTWGLVVLTK